MEKICETEKCTGCMACYNICPCNAIHIIQNKEGFYVPRIDETQCISCNRCRKVCQANNGNTKYNPLIIRYAAKRRKKRMLSQSGGIFLALAEMVLKEGGVAYGVINSEHLQVMYTRVDKRKNLITLAGSKYVQAYVGRIYREIQNDLSKGRKVLFGGTACHVDGLLHFLKADGTDLGKLVTCDLICHGVPSPALAETYWKIVKEYYKTEIKDVNYRNKEYGWRNHVVTYKLKDGREYVSNNYVRLFYSDCMLNSSCYDCKYAKMDRIGDLSIGDCWGIDEVYPRFNDNQGGSLVHINTEKGMETFEKVKGQFIVAPLKAHECIQPNLQHPTPKPAERKEFWDKVETAGWEEAIKASDRFDMQTDELVPRRMLLSNKMIRMGQKIKRYILKDYI